VLALYDSDRELAFVYIFLAYSFEFDESPLKVIGSRIVIPNALWLSVIQDPTLSDTMRVLLLDHLAENSYLEDREKKALRITV
jgi:hypothetical protein